MNALMLVGTIFCLLMQRIAQKSYNVNIKGGAFTFSASSTLFALLFFVISSGGDLAFTTDFLLYSVLFAVFYSAAIVGLFLAIKTGPLSLSSLILSFSLMIPTLFGILVLDEEVKPTLTVGIAILLFALTLINFKKKSDDKKTSLKWWIFILLSFIGNGACTVVQVSQRNRFSGEFKNEFMIVALLIVFITLSTIALIGERRTLLTSLKGYKWFAVCGLANGITNLFIIILSGRMNVSLLLPFVSGGELVMTYVVSRFLYKEKLSAIQSAGFLLGVIAVIVLNI